MRFFIDECLSPALAQRLNASGSHDAIHPRDYGRLGERDDTVLARSIDEDRIIVTENARDFRKLVGAAEIHPGLVILPSVAREEAWRLMQLVIAELEGKPDPDHAMVNHVLEVSANGVLAFYELPKS